MSVTPDPVIADLDARLREARLAAYVKVRAGWPMPLAGAIYWIVLAVLGSHLHPADWSVLAAVMSGALFPVAVALAAIFRNPFMKVKLPDQGVVFMAMAGMLSFWPGAVAAMWNLNDLAPLIIAIGMAAHWPVFGWSYGRPLPFVAHFVMRVIAVTAIWFAMPEGRFTVLPAAVAVIYLITVVWLVIDSGAVARQRAAKVA